MNLNQYADAKLTLFNVTGEQYVAGEITTLIHNNNGLTLRWLATAPFTHILPLTHGMLFRGKNILNTFSITPLDNSVDGTEFELKI